MPFLIDAVDFSALPAEKYWAYPSRYKGDRNKETLDAIRSGEYIGSLKVDGAYYRFVKDDAGNMILQPRNEGVHGGYPNKLGHVPHLRRFFEQLPNGTCLLGELFLADHEGSRFVTSVMNGKQDHAEALQQELGERMKYYVFDVWAYGGKSFLDRPAEERIKTLVDMFYDREIGACEDVWFANYFTDPSDIATFLARYLAEGSEGMVLTKKDSLPEPGKRTARKTLKVKREFSNTVDCFFTGVTKEPTKLYTGEAENWPYWGEENGKPVTVTKAYRNGWAGSLQVGVLDNDGTVVPIGWLSNIPDAWKADPGSVALKPMAITAMQWDKEGLRHARFVSWRDDLVLADCTLDKIRDR